jgi:hypothetical protein
MPAVPSGSDVVVIRSGGTRTVREKTFEADWLPLSLTEICSMRLPADVGVPLSTPVDELIENSRGEEYSTMRQLR